MTYIMAIDQEWLLVMHENMERERAKAEAKQSRAPRRRR